MKNLLMRKKGMSKSNKVLEIQKNRHELTENSGDIRENSENA